MVVRENPFGVFALFSHSSTTRYKRLFTIKKSIKWTKNRALSEIFWSLNKINTQLKDKKKRLQKFQPILIIYLFKNTLFTDILEN